MKFGLWVPNVGNFGDPDLLVELAVAAERGGWDGFFSWDMLTPALATGASRQAVDPMVVLSAVAMETERISLGPMVTPVARRRVQKLARETATLDRLSKGRLILGAGLGDKADDEFLSFGEDPDPRIRAAKLDEALDVLTRLWTGEPVEFRGVHLTIRDQTFLPRPIQEPRIPIWTAGHWPRKRPLERASRWDGMIPLGDRGTLSPRDYREITRARARERKRFDLVHVEPLGDEPPQAVRVDELEQAGVTWWFPYCSPTTDVQLARELAAAAPRPVG